MSYDIIISPPAEIDLIDIQDYYDDLVFGLGERFLLKFQEVLSLLERHPQIYPIIEDEIRRANMNTFPYTVFYSIEEFRNEVEILAVIHQSRNPIYWRTRINLGE